VDLKLWSQGRELTHARAGWLPALALAFGAFLAPAPAAADATAPPPPAPAHTSLDIDVAGPGSVSVVGRSDSLQAVIEALCAKANVELREYRAPDRRLRARYKNMPLALVFERLLRRESFVLGFTQSSKIARPRVSWLRVVGARRMDDRPTAPVVLPREAFTSRSPEARRRAAVGFADRLSKDRVFRQRFMRSDERKLAAQIGTATHTDEFLDTVRTRVRDPRLMAKLTRVVARAARR
jgi:hypothetical protein